MSTDQPKAPDYHNIFAYLNYVSNTFLLKNIYTMETHNDTLNVLTDTNQKLTESWTTGDKSGDLAAMWNYISGSAQGLQDFINGTVPGFPGESMTSLPVQDYSTAVGTKLMNLIAQYYTTSPVSDNAAADNSAVNSMNSIISSQATYEEQPGQNEVKTESSVLQGDTSTQQTVANIADSFQGVFSNIASLLQQLYS